jgi:hypothetical protein
MTHCCSETEGEEFGVAGLNNGNVLTCARTLVKVNGTRKRE